MVRIASFALFISCVSAIAQYGSNPAPSNSIYRRSSGERIHSRSLLTGPYALASRDLPIRTLYSRQLLGDNAPSEEIAPTQTWEDTARKKEAFQVKMASHNPEAAKLRAADVSAYKEIEGALAKTEKDRKKLNPYEKKRLEGTMDKQQEAMEGRMNGALTITEKMSAPNSVNIWGEGTPQKDVDRTAQKAEWKAAKKTMTPDQQKDLLKKQQADRRAGAKQRGQDYKDLHAFGGATNLEERKKFEPQIAGEQKRGGKEGEVYKKSDKKLASMRGKREGYASFDKESINNLQFNGDGALATAKPGPRKNTEAKAKKDKKQNQAKPPAQPQKNNNNKAKPPAQSQNNKNNKANPAAQPAVKPKNDGKSKAKAGTKAAKK